ncbi:MAG TPA: hypothetical protein PLM62_09100 [Zoogloea sp.]|nr:hypothetical protein [Zoogloea sp.]
MDPILVKPDETLYLAAQQQHLRPVRAGTLVLVEEGLVLLEGPPRWLGERMQRARLPIEAGCCHVLEEDGWIGLMSPRGARLRVLAGRPADEDLGDLLVARLRCLRTLENRLLAALAAALRLRVEERETPGRPAP